MRAVRRCDRFLRREEDVQPRHHRLLGVPRHKEDSDVKVGQILSLEGGLGKSFLGGGLIIGAAYYAQWKITKDRLREFVLPGGDDIDLDFPNKHQVFGFGPEVTLPIATKSKLYALVNFRYFWETGAR